MSETWVAPLPHPVSFHLLYPKQYQENKYFLNFDLYISKKIYYIYYISKKIYK